MLHGRAAAYIERGPLNRPVSIDPLPSTGINRELIGGSLKYKAVLKVSLESVDRDNLFFLPFKRPDDGVTDESPLARHWPAVRAALSATMFEAWYFDRGAMPSSVFTLADTKTKIELEKEMAALWRAEDKMRAKGRRSMVVPPGWQSQKMGGNPEEAKLTETRTFGVQEIARIYGIPPLLLQDLSRGTYSNFSQARHGLGEVLEHWAVRVASEFSSILWPAGSRICRFDTSLAVRESFNERLKGYELGIRGGIMTPNEARALEGWEASEQEGADALQIGGGQPQRIIMEGAE